MQHARLRRNRPQHESDEWQQGRKGRDILDELVARGVQRFNHMETRKRAKLEAM